MTSAVDLEDSVLVDGAEIVDPVSGQSFLDQLAARLDSMGRLSANGFNCPGTQFPNFRKASGDLCFTTEQVVRRTMTQTCAGCHNPILLGLGLPGNIGPMPGFPASAAGNVVHLNAVADSGGTHYVISPALRDQFLPFRKTQVESLLNNTP